MNLAKRGGASLMEAELALSVPYRVRGERVVMFHRGTVAHPGEEMAAMEAYLADLEGRLGRPLRAPVHWMRGTLLGGMGRLAVYGVALGSKESPIEVTAEPESLDALDRHEVAHVFMGQMMPPEADPPTILVEGWAEAAAAGWLEPRPEDGDTGAGLPTAADGGLLGAQGETLSGLMGPRWYHQDSGPVYAVGQNLVRYLVEARGGAAVLQAGGDDPAGAGGSDVSGGVWAEPG